MGKREQHVFNIDQIAIAICFVVIVVFVEQIGRFLQQRFLKSFHQGFLESRFVQVSFLKLQSQVDDTKLAQFFSAY
jgi:hypothetical protein